MFFAVFSMVFEAQKLSRRLLLLIISLLVMSRAFIEELGVGLHQQLEHVEGQPVHRTYKRCKWLGIIGLYIGFKGF